jgi:hypothetical protein
MIIDRAGLRSIKPETSLRKAQCIFVNGIRHKELTQVSLPTISRLSVASMDNHNIRKLNHILPYFSLESELNRVNLFSSH